MATDGVTDLFMGSAPAPQVTLCRFDFGVGWGGGGLPFKEGTSTLVGTR